MTDSFENWTIETAVAVAFQAKEDVAKANAQAGAVSKFCESLKQRIEAYGIRSDQVQSLKERFEATANTLKAAEEALDGLAWELDTLGRS